MRRPIDWFVVSISLLVLLANQMLVKDEAPVAAAPDPAAAGPSPFAYVREDGSQLVVSATGQGPLIARPADEPGFEDVHALSGFDGSLDSRRAVYTWSVAGSRITP